jgi:hypothetical protein
MRNIRNGFDGGAMGVGAFDNSGRETLGVVPEALMYGL